MPQIPESSSATTRALVQGFFANHPVESARLLETLPKSEVRKLLESESPESVARLLTRMNPDAAVRIVSRMNKESFVRLFTTIDPIQAAALLARFEQKKLADYLALLPESIAKEYRELMTYPPDSAGRMMDPRVTVFRSDETVGVAVARLRAISDRRILDICIVDDDGVLVGMIPLQVLAIVQPEEPLYTLIREQSTSVQAVSPRSEVVRLLESLRLSSLPVVNIDGKLLGVIRYDTLLEAATHDVAENLQAMVGAGREERALSKASFAIKKRLPWLVVNLGTAFLASAVVGLFEETIAQVTLLAVFLPVVAGQSGNTGSQALAVTLRGLTLREIRARQWPRIALKELLVGFGNGCAIAVLTALGVILWTGNIGIGLVIGVAMVLSMVIAGLAGAVIPALLTSLNQDPVQSSSIILTTVTDVAGFMSFLGLATLFAHFLV